MGRDGSVFSATNFAASSSSDVDKMVETIDLGPANPRISPLIKLSRWSLLVGGIFWGVHRYKVNKAAEDEIRAYNARMKPIWDAQAVAEKAKANKEEMEKLAKQFR